MNYSGISECDVLNGTGFRVVLFVSGCSHRCYNCQNSKTWDKNFGHPFTEKTKQYIFNCLDKDYIDGITITGGDPLHENNLDEILKLVQELRISLPTKTIWLYTGYSYSEIFRGQSSCLSQEGLNNFKRREIIKQCDVLVDGEYIDEQRDLTKKWAGSSNQCVIDIQKSLAQNKMILYCD
jgi:anaerobic ribonucleoside-triphosphate reductase activating protein